MFKREKFSLFFRPLAAGICVVIIVYVMSVFDIHREEPAGNLYDSLYYAYYLSEKDEDINDVINNLYSDTDIMKDIGYSGVKEKLLRMNHISNDADIIEASTYLIIPCYQEDLQLILDRINY